MSEALRNFFLLCRTDQDLRKKIDSLASTILIGST
jgi:hypothetical protein